VGDAVFFRPAKAGEIAERFNVYHLIEYDSNAGTTLRTVPTYRGLGGNFY
jgi:D-serine deaminase-like pyridoxal phosphate-dependent protein